MRSLAHVRISGYRQIRSRGPNSKILPIFDGLDDVRPWSLIFGTYRHLQMQHHEAAARTS